MKGQASVGAVLVLLCGLIGGCFDGEELSEGLRCEKDSHCGGKLQCVNLNAGGVGQCGDPDACADTGICDVSVSVSTTVDSVTVASAESACAPEGASCAAGETCCAGICADIAGVATCAQQCYAGSECASTCCCQPVNAMSANACVDLAFCGQEAACPGAGCASPGSVCSSDYDCCGGRCSLNGAGTANQCFKTCTVPTDCVSGCCNYHGELGTSLCEAC